MGLFDKIKEPVFLKEGSSAKEQLQALQQLLCLAEELGAGEIKKQIEQEMRNLLAGIAGEEQILFELKNSHMPLWVIHDLYLEAENEAGELQTAQIDFLVVTRQRNFLIECKNLYGDIEVNSAGDFVRTTEWSGRRKKEGIYSPITQNTRHLELLKKIRVEKAQGLLKKPLVASTFYDIHRAVVVLANPKTVLNAKYATKEIKSKLIRADGLIEYIKRVNREKGFGSEMSGEQDTAESAAFYLSLHKEPNIDYTKRFREALEASGAQASALAAAQSRQEKPAQAGQMQETALPKPPRCPVCGADTVRRRAGRGERAGKEFYGCVQYPRCHGIVNIEE